MDERGSFAGRLEVHKITAGLRRLATGGMAAVFVTGLALVAIPTAAGASSTWSVTSSPNSGVDGNVLEGVSCISTTSCKAVGYYDNSSGVSRTLIESWNGSTWTIQSSPNDGAKANRLEGVSCVSATSCKAVGYYSNSSGVFLTLVESLSGSTWTIHSSPNDGTGDNYLQGVSCLSTTFCQAVGWYGNATSSQTLTESWNGSSWTITSSQDNGVDQKFEIEHGTLANVLHGVSCVTTTSCQAVGYYYASATVYLTLVESWNGSSWTITSSPNEGTDSNLGGVSCVTATSCQAVGFYYNSSDDYLTLVESWNGSSWTITSSPDKTPSKNNEIHGVSCVSVNTCEAVGGYYVNGTLVRSLVESWNGSSWTITSSPNSGTNNNVLGAVSCVSAVSCQAVGQYDSNDHDLARTLIESFG